MIDAGTRLTALAAQAAVTAEFLQSFAQVDFSPAPGPVPPSEAASIPVAGPTVAPGRLAHPEGAASQVPAAARAPEAATRSLDGLRAPVPLAALSRGASLDGAEHERGRAAARRDGLDSSPPAPSPPAMPSTGSGGRTFPETVPGRHAPAGLPGEDVEIGAAWPAAGSASKPEAEAAEPAGWPALASDLVEPDGALLGVRARPGVEASDDSVAARPSAMNAIEPNHASPGARVRSGPGARDEAATERLPGSPWPNEAGPSSDDAGSLKAAQAAAEAEHVFGLAALADATAPTQPRRDGHVAGTGTAPVPGAERAPDEPADAPVVSRATAEALPVIRRDAVADIDLRFFSDAAGAVVGSLPIEGTGIAAALAFNLALLPGRLPPRAFEVPDGEELLARLLGAAHREGSEDEAAGRLAARAGQPALAAGVLFRLRKLSRARRLRALLGLMALMDTVEVVIEAVEGELLELSRARREAAEDWADAGARRSFRA